MNKLFKISFTFISFTTAFLLNASEVQVMPTMEQNNQEEFNSYILPPDNTPSIQNEFSQYRATNDSENETDIQPPPPEAVTEPVPEVVVPPQE